MPAGQALHQNNKRPSLANEQLDFKIRLGYIFIQLLEETPSRAKITLKRKALDSV